MKRLLDGAGSDFEQGLLDALKLERPSAEMEQRMRDALGLGPGPAPAPVAPAAPAAKAFGGWGAVAAGTVVAALVVGGGVLVKSQLGAEEAPLPAATPVKITPSEPPNPAPTPAVASDLESLAPTVVDDSNTKPRARSTHGGSNAIQNPQSLREEIELIDAARVAVKNKEGARAVQLLDRYSRRFPEGAFKEEARVLRAEAQKNRASAP
jgi:hypothetical protein